MIVDWHLLGGGNGEQQCYTSRSTNVQLSGGNLVLSAVPGSYTGTQSGCTNTADNSCTRTQPFTSGRVKTLLPTDFTKTQGTWLYGKWEIRAKLPAGSGLKPGMFMFPAAEVYGPWAASGAITLMVCCHYSLLFSFGFIHMYMSD